MLVRCRILLVLITDHWLGGRGYPDISAQGLYFAFAWNQTFSSISGTSASTPLSASIIFLVNDELIACHKRPLGFLNPWLYSKGYKGFTDILAGNSSSCGTAGFPITKGWDPVTGFGTPVCISFSDENPNTNKFARFSPS